MKKKLTRVNKKIVFLLCFLIVGANLWADANSDIAKVYLSAADNFFKENKFDETELFLDKSALYDPTLSDIYYIRTSLGFSFNNDINEQINLLKKAITYRNWKIYNESQAFYLLGKLYARIRDYDRALSSLYVVREAYIDNEDFLDVYTSSLIHHGDFKGAAENLNFAVQRFPENTAFVKRLIGIDTRYRETLLIDVLNSKDYNPDIIIELARLSDDPGVKLELLQTAQAKGANNIELFLEYISLSGKTIPEDIDTFYKLNGFSDFKYIRSISGFIRDKNIQNLLFEKYKNYSGIVKEDINNDGSYERILSVTNGVPQWYSEDINQDNINDFFIGFQNGKPAFINLQEKMLIVYYTYPYIKTVILFNTDLNEIYSFADKRAQLDILDYSIYLYPPVFKNINVLQQFNSVKNRAVSVKKVNKGNEIGMIIEYLKTENLADFETYDQFNSIVRRGKIRSGRVTFSEADHNNDSIFETLEIYRDGILREIRYDGNANGIFEFKIEDGIKYWDFNEDSIWDAREWFEDNEKIKYNEFAVNMDGNFNFTAKYENGILLEVKRNNVWQKVERDNINNIYWIGTIPSGAKNIKINRGKDKDIFIGNNRVMIFKVGDNYYAEVSN